MKRRKALKFLEKGDTPRFIAAGETVLMAGLEPARPFEAGDFLATLCCHSRARRVVVWTMS